MAPINLAESYEKYGFFVFRRALMFLGNEQDAKDAVQDIFLTVLRKIDTFRGQSSFFTWLYRLTTNHCLNIIRRNRYHIKAMGVLTVGIKLQEQLSRQKKWEEKITIMQVLEKFDAQTQELVLCHYIEGLTQDEIAKATGISRRTIGKRLKHFSNRCGHILNVAGQGDRQKSEKKRGGNQST